MTLFLTPLKQNYLTRTPSSRILTPTQTVTRSSLPLPPCLGKELSLSLAPIPLPPSTPTPFIPFILMHHMCRETRLTLMRHMCRATRPARCDRIIRGAQTTCRNMHQSRRMLRSGRL
uniref:Uncharacterized protein n=1 Tax=Cacopsylla melanoneura TaxID=428564 RepID=A0A8D9ABP5_9HEMI